MPRSELESFRLFIVNTSTRSSGALDGLDAATLPAADLDRERKHPRRDMLTGREVLIVVARHTAEHWGEAQLTKSLLLAERA